ncbi:hypothetical protein AAE478_004434 [Parahypoxylon ruwenzoriense]
MITSFDSLYPLSKASRQDLADLCEILWFWRPCSDWIEDRDCEQRLRGVECSCQRAEKLASFFDFYRDVTAFYVPELTGDSVPALEAHRDLLEIIKSIKSNTDKPRLQLTLDYFNGCTEPGSQRLPSSDQNRAFSLAIRVMTMMQCSIDDQSDGLLETGSQPIVWRGDQSFNQFISSAIPRRNQVSFESQNDSPQCIKLPTDSVTASRLKHVAKLRIIATNNLRNHLLLDERNGTISIYHYTSVLKEHLGMTQNEDAHGASKLSTNQQKLTLETLNTLKHVIFPVEPKSQSILRSLVAREEFDPDNCHVDISSCQPVEGESIRYEFWGARLMRLHDEVENPTPRGFLENWLERKSGARYIMLVTISGVLIAILLGILSLAVTIFQAWVSWQQWQHPVT